MMPVGTARQSVRPTSRRSTTRGLCPRDAGPNSFLARWHHRRRIAPIPASQQVKATWDELSDHYPDAETVAFVVMPDHTHAIIVSTPMALPVVGAGPRACPDEIDSMPDGSGQPQGVAPYYPWNCGIEKFSGGYGQIDSPVVESLSRTGTQQESCHEPERRSWQGRR